MIKNYRKKPVVVETILWDGTNANEIIEWTKGHAKLHTMYGENRLVIPTLEGMHYAEEGDYIIKGVKGEFYPCKGNIFHMTYEEAV